jgi:hypothetical protein
MNAVSLEAEAWFWRVHAIADDFGNLPGSLPLLRAYAAPLRNMVDADAKKLTDELLSVGLIGVYEVENEVFIHVDQFERRQPAGKNGKRVQKYPTPSGGIQVNPGESRGILASDGRVQPTIPIPIPIPIPKPTPKKRSTDPPVGKPRGGNEQTRLWDQLYETRFNNGHYPWQAKDAILLAKVAKSVGGGITELERIVVRYLECAEPFFQGHPIGKLLSQLPKFTAKTEFEQSWEKAE